MLIASFIYFRQYITFRQLAYYFQVSASTIYRSVCQIERLLIEMIGENNLIHQSLQEKIIVVDVTEIPIERPKYVQNVYYSGKKKCHTVKFQVTIDLETKKILNIYIGQGSEHDFSIFKKTIEYYPSDSIIIADKGYTGIKKYFYKAQIPYKNSLKKTLSKSQLKYNEQLNRFRVKIEHVFGAMKRFKILSTKYRNNLNKLYYYFYILAAIYNIQI